MEAVVVAVIAAVGGVLAALVQGFRKENRNDHAMVSQALNRIEVKLDNHIDDHLKGDI
jgi:Na+-translocating ferredoxin:NAD+ oxidoreductase RnfG subunit